MLAPARSNEVVLGNGAIGEEWGTNSQGYSPIRNRKKISPSALLALVIEEEEGVRARARNVRLQSPLHLAIAIAIAIAMHSKSLSIGVPRTGRRRGIGQGVRVRARSVRTAIALASLFRILESSFLCLAIAIQYSNDLTMDRLASH